mmetsp:Transcript_12695/g.30013  ORF Transcript_12695/g.30013 Transcript_12695/m.30013 type:complete len:315 (-) Transcript_12695:40-984(-)
MNLYVDLGHFFCLGFIFGFGRLLARMEDTPGTSPQTDVTGLLMSGRGGVHAALPLVQFRQASQSDSLDDDLELLLALEYLVDRASQEQLLFLRPKLLDEHHGLNEVRAVLLCDHLRFRRRKLLAVNKLSSFRHVDDDILDERDLARLRTAGCALLLLGNDRLQACLVIAQLFSSDLATHHINCRRTCETNASKKSLGVQVFFVGLLGIFLHALEMFTCPLEPALALFQRQVGAVPLLLGPSDIAQRLVAVPAARQAVELRRGQRRQVVEGRARRGGDAGTRLALLAGGHWLAGLTHLSFAIIKVPNPQISLNKL